MSEVLRRHYERYPYPCYPLLARLRRHDTYALNLEAVWTRFNGVRPQPTQKRILIAGCGSFAPYPFALANPDCDITALDLSRRSLTRAKLHCLLHGQTAPTFHQGDILHHEPGAQPYGMIDAFGVLHHLDDPLAGLLALERALAPGGIMRIMVYSRYARKEEESIRRALRLLGITNSAEVRQFLKRARPGSRLHRYLTASDEITYEAGLADALLHPRVATFRIDELLDMVSHTGLQPLQFIHPGALVDVVAERQRLRSMEQTRQSPGNFVLFLGKQVTPPADEKRSTLMLNPCLTEAVSRFRFGTLSVAPRLGCDNPLLDGPARRLLRTFRLPQLETSVPDDVRQLLPAYLRALFLVRFARLLLASRNRTATPHSVAGYIPIAVNRFKYK